MKRYVVALEKEERDELAGITRKGSHQSQKVINALILLNCDEGEFNEHRARGEAVAEILRISARKVARVKKRFVEQGMEAALGGRQGRRPSYVRKADGEFEARLVALSCAEPPEGHSQWSLRLLADRVVELRPHRQCVARDGAPGAKKNAIKPWRRVGWVIPPQGNADFAAAMERVLDVYRRPYDAAFPVVCMDETPRQLLSETREPVPAAPGRPAREDYEYRRCGSCNVFMATEPLAGRRMTKVTARRTKTDWAHFLNDIAERHPGAKRITLVMDNLNTHRPGALYEAFPPPEGQGPVGPLRVRLHAQARQLAQRRRGRAQRHDPSVPQPPHRLPQGPARRGRGLAGVPRPHPGQGQLAVHYGRRPRESQTPLSDI